MRRGANSATLPSVRARTWFDLLSILTAVASSAFVARAQATSPRSAAAAASSAPSPPRAPDAVPDDVPVSGELRSASEPADPAREVANVVLYLPRVAIDLLFVTSGAAAGLLEDEQVIPRLEDTFYTADHAIGVFPTAFVETGFNPNIGARMLASAGDYAATIRAGYGGIDSNIVESRIRTTTVTPVLGALSFEALHDRQTNLGYVGLGPVPESDPRNVFQPGSGLRGGAYRQVRERLIVNFGFRPAADAELLLSTSYRRRRIDDAPGAGQAALGAVFVPGDLPGAFRLNRSTYSEVAIRYDTRVHRGPPTRGWMVEGYAGALRGIKSGDGDGSAFGGRAAAFIPIYRVSNILSPRIEIDTMFPGNPAAFPFYDYAAPTEFRGIDPRRDRIAAIASLDYRWVVMKYVAARLFMDSATVARDFSSLDLHAVRYAWGMGMDLHSSSAEIARVGASVSPQGFRFFLSLGVAPSGFGDRQHR